MGVPDVRQRARQILLGGRARDTQMLPDLLDRETGEAMQHQGRGDLRRQGFQRALEPLDSLLHIGRGRWIISGGQLQVGKEIGNIDGDGCGGLLERMLVQYVAGNREKVSFGTANRLVMLDPQKSQEDLLRQVRRIGVVAQAFGQKAAQPLAVSARDRGNKILAQFQWQVLGSFHAHFPINTKSGSLRKVDMVILRLNEQRLQDQGVTCIRPLMRIHQMGSLRIHFRSANALHPLNPREAFLL